VCSLSKRINRTPRGGNQPNGWKWRCALREANVFWLPKNHQTLYTIYIHIIQFVILTFGVWSAANKALTVKHRTQQKRNKSTINCCLFVSFRFILWFYWVKIGIRIAGLTAIKHLHIFSIHTFAQRSQSFRISFLPLTLDGIYGRAVVIWLATAAAPPRPTNGFTLTIVKLWQLECPQKELKSKINVLIQTFAIYLSLLELKWRLAHTHSHTLHSDGFKLVLLCGRCWSYKIKFYAKSFHLMGNNFLRILFAYTLAWCSPISIRTGIQRIQSSWDLYLWALEIKIRKLFENLFSLSKQIWSLSLVSFGQNESTLVCWIVKVSKSLLQCQSPSSSLSSEDRFDGVIYIVMAGNVRHQRSCQIMQDMTDG
jgi:hypothetical protein